MARDTATQHAWEKGQLDAYARALVRVQPIPHRLIENLRRAGEGEAFTQQRPHRRRRGDQMWEVGLLRRYGVRRPSPDEMDTRMHSVLTMLCHGFSKPYIAKRIRYAKGTVDDLIKVLLILFDARDRGHLCALAVAKGYVKMTEA